MKIIRMCEEFAVSVMRETRSHTLMDMALYTDRMKMVIEVRVVLKKQHFFVDVYTHCLSFLSDVTLVLC